MDEPRLMAATDFEALQLGDLVTIIGESGFRAVVHYRGRDDAGSYLFGEDPLKHTWSELCGWGICDMCKQQSEQNTSRSTT